jgi:hypothetical protein
MSDMGEGSAHWHQQRRIAALEAEVEEMRKIMKTATTAALGLTGKLGKAYEENAELLKDAERYRHKRDADCKMYGYKPDEYDSAIDKGLK